MAKREYLKDYIEAEDGSYTYVGARWAWPNTETRAGCLKKLWLLFVVAFVCIIAAGCIPASGSSGAAYVVLPYAASIVGAALTATSLVRLTQEADPLRDYVYKRTVPALPAKLAFMAGSALLGVVAIVVYMLIKAQEPELLNAVWALCMFAAAVSAWRAVNTARNLSFSKV